MVFQVYNEIHDCQHVAFVCYPPHEQRHQPLSRDHFDVNGQLSTQMGPQCRQLVPEELLKLKVPQMELRHAL